MAVREGKGDVRGRDLAGVESLAGRLDAEDMISPAQLLRYLDDERTPVAARRATVGTRRAVPPDITQPCPRASRSRSGASAGPSRSGSCRCAAIAAAAGSRSNRWTHDLPALRHARLRRHGRAQPSADNKRARPLAAAPRTRPRPDDRGYFHEQGFRQGPRRRGGRGVPELAVSPHRNLVTRSGLAQIERTLRPPGGGTDLGADGRRQGARRAHRAGPALLPAAAGDGGGRDSPGSAGASQVRIRVRLETDAGERVEFRIVGEDESDPSRGLISYVSPLAEALMGGTVGDRLPFRGTEARNRRDRIGPAGPRKVRIANGAAHQ